MIMNKEEFKVECNKILVMEKTKGNRDLYLLKRLGITKEEYINLSEEIYNDIRLKCKMILPDFDRTKVFKK